jgi:DNA polymerase III delta prime subunit
MVHLEQVICFYLSNKQVFLKLLDLNLGKTSTIIACAKKMFGEHYSAMTLELNASDDRGIDTVRNQIKEFAGTKAFGANTKQRHIPLL